MLSKYIDHRHFKNLNKLNFKACTDISFTVFPLHFIGNLNSTLYYISVSPITSIVFLFITCFVKFGIYMIIIFYTS